MYGHGKLREYKRLTSIRACSIGLPREELLIQFGLMLQPEEFESHRSCGGGPLGVDIHYPNLDIRQTLYSAEVVDKVVGPLHRHPSHPFREVIF